MPFYSIEAIRPEENNYKSFVFKGLEEYEVELNKGYSIAKELVEYLHAHAGAEENVSLFILYKDEHMSYLVKETAGQQFLTLPQRIASVKWGVHNEKLETDFAAHKVILRGSASPLVLHQREENLLDELVQSFPKESFAIQVKLSLKKKEDIQPQIKELERRINELSKAASIQAGEQGNFGENIKKAIIGGENLSYQISNITARQQVELLQNHLSTLKTQGYVFKHVEYTVFSNKKTAEEISSKMEQFSRRSGAFHFHHLSEKSGNSNLEFLDYVPANYVASVIAIPMSGVPGIHVNQQTIFPADIRKNNVDDLSLGKLISHHETSLPVTMPFSHLNRHAFVSGVTGSGKTSTIKSILLKSYEKQVPFLIIEPAKTEYKFLQRLLPSCKVYSLGIEGERSFKINPFYFPAGIHLQTHVDHLKSVFVAAFPMYGPMPYILETALYSIYKRKGWDFLSGRNLYEADMNRKDLFPSLDDLYLEIEDAIDAVGYSQDLSSDVRGALKVRIGSLLSGAKGSMLNTRRGISIDEMLQTPTILELEAIGDDQEKVFLMGLLLISIYEQYTSQGKYTKNIRHLLVIEEAHRLLEKTMTNGNSEIGDMKGKAVETFNHILSEIRAYGQGIIIADQIPSKLSPDIIKNTNLKIIHRMFSKEDREILGHSIALEENQINELIRLKQGQAVIFHGDIDQAMKVKIEVPSAVLADDEGGFAKSLKLKSIDVTVFILQEQDFKKELYQILQSAWLFPRLRIGLSVYVKELINKRWGLNVSELQENDLWRKVINRYLIDCRMDRLVPYPELVKLQHKMDEEMNVLEIFYKWMDRHIQNSESKKFGRLAPVSPKWSRLLFMPSNRDLINKTLSPHQLSLMNCDQINSLVMEHPAISSIVKLNLLLRFEQQQLQDAFVLEAASANEGLLEQYFKFVEL